MENVSPFKVRQVFLKKFFLLLLQLNETRLTKISENQKVSISLKKPFKINTVISKQIYNCHSPKGIKLIVRLGVGLSHLCKDKFKYSFQDTLNPICKCIKILKPHLIIFIAQTIYKKRWLSWIHPFFNNDQETEIFSYGTENLDDINNTSILDDTIKYLIETKTFDAFLFWCSPDAMPVALLLLLKFIFRFLVFVLFCVVYPLPVALDNPYFLTWNIIIFLLFLGYYWTDVSQVIGNNWSVGWLVGW